MKNIKTLLLLCMLGGMALFGTTACSGDDDSVVTPDDGVKLRHITIREADGSAVPRRLRPLAVDCRRPAGLLQSEPDEPYD